MTIERFNKQQFENALPAESEAIGIVNGEYCYEIPLGNAKILVRSTIDASGVARDVADDSIRVTLLTLNEQPLVLTQDWERSHDWVSRVSGWQDRLKKKIANRLYLYKEAGTCQQCGKPMVVRTVTKAGANRGKHFSACFDRHENPFKWISIDGELDNPYEYITELNNRPEPEPVQFKVTADLPKYNPADLRPLDLSRYNPDQLRFIKNACKGPSVVAASAGSGKTTTLVGTIAYMLQQGVHPSRILVVTFSRKAAAEMRQRIAKYIWPDITERELAFFGDPRAKQDANPLEDDVIFDRAWVETDPIRKFLVDWVCTIHAMSLRLLKAAGRNAKPLESDKQAKWQADSIIKDALDEYQLKFSPKSVRAWIDQACTENVMVTRAREWFGKKLGPYGDLPEVTVEFMVEVYTRFLNFLRPKGLLTFAMMQSELNLLVKNDVTFRMQLKGMFDYILVDEGQDTDNTQSNILWTISNGNISFIGDEKQTLYRFRGAKPSVIAEDFFDRWGADKVQVFPMGLNYRSTKTIVDESNKFIKRNYVETGREKYYYPAEAIEASGIGEKPSYYEFDSFDAMSEAIVNTCVALDKVDSTFVLSRTRAECAAIQMKFIELGVPCVNLSGGMLLGADHIQKVLAYARLACDYHDARNDDETLKKVANVASDQFVSPSTRRRHKDTCKNDKPWVDCGCPIIVREGIDHSTVRYYGEAAINDAGGKWIGVMRQRDETTSRGGFPTMRSKGATDLVDFVLYLETLKHDALACIRAIIDKSVLPWLKHEEGIDDEDLAENGKQEDFDLIVNMIKEGETLEQFLDDVEDLSSRNKESDKCVKIGTVHAVKGLENDVVILNMTRLPIIPPKRKEGQLPSPNQANSTIDERQIAYVGMTRAKKTLILCGSTEWNHQEMPTSPFVKEMGYTFGPMEQEADDLDEESDDEGGNP